MGGDDAPPYTSNLPKRHTNIDLFPGERYNIDTRRTITMQDKHKYRVSVYLGKELYEQISVVAEFMGVGVATMAKIILTTGFELSKQLENQTKGVIANGKQQSKVS